MVCPAKMGAIVVNSSVRGKIKVDVAYTHESDRAGALVGGLVGRMGDYGSSVVENCFCDVVYQESDNYHDAPEYIPGMLTGNITSTYYVLDTNKRVAYGNFYFARAFDGTGGEGGFLYPIAAVPFIQGEPDKKTEEDNFAVSMADELVTGEWTAPLAFHQAFSPSDEDPSVPRYDGSYCDVHEHYSIALSDAANATSEQKAHTEFGSDDNGFGNWMKVTDPGEYPVTVTITRKPDAKKSALCSGIFYEPLTFDVTVSASGAAIIEPTPVDPVPAPSTTNPQVVIDDSGNVTLKPTASTGNGVAKAEVSGSDADKMVKAVQGSDSKQIVIEPQVKTESSTVQVALTKQAAAALSENDGGKITIRTETADVTLSGRALGDAAQNAHQTVAVGTTLNEDGVIRIEIAVDGKVLERVTDGLNAKVSVPQTGPGVVAVLQREDGTEEVVKNSVLTDSGTLAVSLEGSAQFRIEDRTKDFVDVHEHWGADAAAFVSAREILSGTSADTFSPELPMTRGMLVTAIYRFENEPEAGEASFSDVPPGTWYTQAVAWASESGIVTGTDTGFAPNTELTRESLAVILYRYAEKLGLDTAASGMTAKEFTDSEDVSGWAADAMRWVVSNGIVTGKTGDVLDPNGTATRAEVATMLMRFVKHMAEF